MKHTHLMSIVLCGMIILPIHTTQAYSFKPLGKKETPRFSPKKIEPEKEHDLISGDCCDATKHKKDCATQKVCTIISKLNMLKSQVSTIDTALDAGFSSVQAELDEIAEVQEFQSSKLDDCCATLSSQINNLTNIVNIGFDDTSLQLQVVTDKENSIISKIDSLDSDLKECCATLNSKIDALASCECDLVPAVSAIDQCCSAIMSSLAALDNEIAECCATFNSKLDGVDNDIIECCATVQSKLDSLAVSSDVCCGELNSKIDALTICNPTPITSITTLSSAGSYCLAQDITSSTGPVIIFAGALASNINLDLNGHTLSTTGIPASAIFFDNAFTYTNIEIYNGHIAGSTSAGININGSVTGNYAHINIHDISVSNANVGFNLNTIQNLVIENCVLFNNRLQLLIADCSEIKILKTIIKQSIAGGLGADIESCQNILIQDSYFNQNDNSGLNASLINNMHIENSFFNSNVVGGFTGNQINDCLIEKSFFNSNQEGFFFGNSSNITLRIVTANENTDQGFFVVNSDNVIIESSQFNQNAATGCNASQSSHVLINNSQFNNNGFFAGLSLTRCTDIQVQNSDFSNIELATQQAGCTTFDIKNVVFDHCSFNGNLSVGAIVQGSLASRFIKFIECQAHENQNGAPFAPAGFTVTGNAADIEFDTCFTCSNQNGIRINGLTNSDCQNITIINSTAKANREAGFLLGIGTGLLKENQVIKNGICGFNDLVTTTSNYKYVANMAIANGSNPAGIPLPVDSNYCSNTLPSSFIPNGPGTFPFRQVNLDTPPSSYWNNITL